MRPVLVELFGFPVPTHEFFIGLGLVAGTVVFIAQARRRGAFTEQHVWVIVGALIGGGLLAHLGSMVRYGGEADSFFDLWMFGGRSILGGLAGAYLGGVVAKRLVGYRGSTGDLLAPAVAIGIGIGRIGCFLTEQVGTATTMPWGISVSAEAAAAIPLCPQCGDGQAMHPSFLYEIGFHLLAFVVLWRFRDRVTNGLAFKLYLLAYGTTRFLIEFVRGNPHFWAGLSGSQIFLLLTMPLLVMAAVRRRRPVPSPIGVTP
jgi:phosphatidylglycerol:prolipoprotein diacylglycerol transferase